MNTVKIVFVLVSIDSNQTTEFTTVDMALSYLRKLTYSKHGVMVHVEFENGEGDSCYRNKIEDAVAWILKYIS